MSVLGEYGLEDFLETFSIPGSKNQKGGPGSGNWGHSGNPPKVGGSGVGGFDATGIKDLNGKYIPGKVGGIAGIDTSDWNKDSTGAQFAMKKIAKLEELASEGKWDEVVKIATWTTKAVHPDKYKKGILEAQKKILEYKDKEIAKPPVDSKPAKEPGVLSSEGWQQIGGKLGTQPGGTYLGPDGKKYYVKQPSDPALAHNEVLAFKLYEAAGGNVPKAHLLEIDGKVSVATEWLDNSKKANWTPTEKNLAAEDFALHAWLNNRDAVGAGSENPMDNIKVETNLNKMVMIDAGGALDKSGLGGKKPFSGVADEWDTLRDAKYNKSTHEVFGKMTSQQLIGSAKKLESISDNEIAFLVNKHHGGSASEKSSMISTLQSRKQDILKRAKELESKTAIGEKPTSTKAPVAMPPKPTSTNTYIQAKYDLLEKASKISIEAVEKINAPGGVIGEYKKSILSAMKSGGKPDVNHVSPPKPKSIKIDEKKFPSDPNFVGSHKDTNNAHVNDLKNLAKTGDIDALKAAESNLPPSPKLKSYHKELVANLANQLNPPPPPKRLDDSYLEAVKKLGNAKGKTGLKEVGKWAIVGDIGGVPKESPKGEWFMNGYTQTDKSKALWEQGQNAYNKASGHKSAIRDYTGSSYISMNHAIRSGDFTSSSGKKGLSASKGLMKHSIELPEGMMLSRKHGPMTNEADLRPGVVVSDRAILSTAVRESSWSGSVQWKMVLSKGVKGLPVESFSKNGGEHEVLLPPNQKILVTKVEKSGSNTIVSALVLPTEDNQCCPP